MFRATKQRQRLVPELRQSFILDHAADIVAAEGISVVSAERVATVADVVRSLAYVCFQSTTELLQYLLQRELKCLRRKQAEAV